MDDNQIRIFWTDDDGEEHEIKPFEPLDNDVEITFKNDDPWPFLPRFLTYVVNVWFPPHRVRAWWEYYRPIWKRDYHE